VAAQLAASQEWLSFVSKYLTALSVSGVYKVVKVKFEFKFSRQLLCRVSSLRCNAVKSVKSLRAGGTYLRIQGRRVSQARSQQKLEASRVLQFSYTMKTKLGSRS
jgi:hypothetical protein